MSSLKMSYCYLAFRTNVLLNLCCPGHLSYYSPNEREPLETQSVLFIINHNSSCRQNVKGDPGRVMINLFCGMCRGRSNHGLLLFGDFYRCDKWYIKAELWYVVCEQMSMYDCFEFIFCEIAQLCYWFGVTRWCPKDRVLHSGADRGKVPGLRLCCEEPLLVPNVHRWFAYLG